MFRCLTHRVCIFFALTPRPLRPFPFDTVVFIFGVQLENGGDENACVNGEATLPNAAFPVGPLGTPREDLSYMEAKVGALRIGACIWQFLRAPETDVSRCAERCGWLLVGGNSHSEGVACMRCCKTAICEEISGCRPWCTR